MSLFINIALIVLMLFLLSIFSILLFHKGRGHYPNILLAIYLISQIIGIADGLLKFGFPDGKGFPYIFFPIIFVWVPFFYFYIMSLLYSDFRLTWKHWFHFVPFVVVLAFTTKYFYLQEYSVRIQLISNNEIYQILFHYFGMIFNTQIVVYNVVALVQYRKYQKKLKDEYSVIDYAGNNWLKTALFGFVAACLIVQVGNYSQRFNVLTSVNWYFVGNMAFFIFFNILFYKAIISPDILNRSLIREKYKHSALNVTEANKILGLLEKNMTQRKPFTDASLSLKGLSAIIDIPERYLSQVINEHRQQNFFDFVNSYRVKYAMELLKEKSNNRRTMLDIMFDAGFNSKSTFNNAFKKHSGYTPSDFKKMNS